MGFRVLIVAQVQEELSKGNFKPNCAVVLMVGFSDTSQSMGTDKKSQYFFIRHGILTPENEPDFPEITARIHRAHEFPLADFSTN